MSTRIHEYPLEAGTRLAYTVRWVGIGIASGATVGFLVGLGASITVNEAFIDVWYDFDLDPLSRILIPLLFVALIAGVLLYAVADSIYNWTLARQLSRAAALTPALVPPQWQRESLRRDHPLAGATGVSWTIFGAALLFALIMLAILGETNDSEVDEVSTMLRVSAVVAALALGIALAVGWASKHLWPRTVSAALGTWGRQAVSAATSADSERPTPRTDRLDLGSLHGRLSSIVGRGLSFGIGATVAGSAIGFFGVWLRQPCRRCDERSFDPPVEQFINVVAVVGASVAAIGMLVLVIVAVAAAAASLISDRALRESALDGGRRPSRELLRARLASWSLAESLGLVSAAVGAVALTTGLSFLAIARPIRGDVLDALVWGGVALIALAGILSFAGVGANGRLRSALRERWAPDDTAIAVAGRKRRRKAQRP